jgi:hypothetical protein
MIWFHARHRCADRLRLVPIPSIAVGGRGSQFLATFGFPMVSGAAILALPVQVKGTA